jgi:hypothetical protein
MNIKYSSTYFDRQSLEEDVTMNLDYNMQLKYQQLDKLHESIFSESSLLYAKVNKFPLPSKAQRKSVIREALMTLPTFTAKLYYKLNLRLFDRCPIYLNT